MIGASKKKHILFIHSSSELYGSDRSLLYLIKMLDKEKYRLTVLLPCEGPLVDELSGIGSVTVTIYPIAVLRRKNLSIQGFIRYVRDFFQSYTFVKKMIRKEHIDIVYTNVAVVFPGAVAATFCKNCKSVWHIREIIQNRVERVVVSFVVNHFADVIIANSKATGEAICNTPEKLRVVYNAVEEKNTAVSHFDKQNVVIGMAGRINRWKGQQLFVDMAELVHKRCPEAKFEIAGAAYSGEEHLEKKLREYIVSKNLSDVVNMLGQVTDMDSFYQSLDIFVLPSIQPEPFGLVVIEAMEKKIPVIATNHGGPVEIITEGEDGYLVPFKNPRIMAERCIQLINDWRLREEMGEKAQKKKRMMFSLEQTVKGIDALLTEL